jgi:3-phosphoglycerate kinase
MTMKTTDELDVRGRWVLGRADLNVPLDGSRHRTRRWGL